MPHVALVAFTGFRVVDPALRELGLSLPGLRRRGEAIAALPALGLLTIAAHTPKHWTQAFFEAPAFDDALIERIAAERPDLVAISALTSSIEEAYSLCAELGRRQIATVIGGLHATSLPDEVLKHADAVAVGDGETVWPNLLADVEAGQLKGKYQGSPYELDESKLPRWDLLPPGKRHRYTVQTERGCPLACEFCAASRLLGSFREKPAECIGRELAVIKGLDPRATIELADDNTFAGRRDPQALLAVLKEAGLPWFTECDHRIANHPTLAGDMAAAGCAQVLVGIESHVHDYSGMGPKGCGLQHMRNAVERIQAQGLPVNACFVTGADGETEQTLNELGELLEDWPSAEVQLTIQTPFPGTALRRQLEGRLLEDRSWCHHNLFEVTYRPSHMTVSQLETGFRKLLAQVYRPEASRRRMQIRKQILRQRNPLNLRE